MSPEVLHYAAFTDDPAGGNPAGVVLNASGMASEEMAEVAASVGYSETAFLAGSSLRFFSPRGEVPFCGHATVATAVALASRSGSTDRFVFTTPAGDVPVTVVRRDGRFIASLTSVPTWSRDAHADERERALSALRLDGDDLDPAHPVHVAFAGNRHLIVPLRSRSRLAALSYDTDALLAVMEDSGWTTVHVTWRETPSLWRARDPFPTGGVVEDPATGAAAAAFGGYLRALGLAPPPTSITIVQGEDMGRRSVLTVDLDPEDDRSVVSGAAVELHPTGTGAE
ncbi:MAG: PhzF family phenazine biosynthesis protein [Actinomycetes bacterium]